MKKIVFLIFMIFFATNVYAENYYEEVHIYTIFKENVDISKISGITVFFDDYMYNEHDAFLTKQFNFETTLYDVPIGDLKFNFGLVKNDEYGKYNIQGKIVATDNKAELIIIVDNQNNKKSDLTTTTKQAITEQIDEEKKSKNYTAIIIFYIAIGAIIFLLLLFCSLKILKANK